MITISHLALLLAPAAAPQQPLVFPTETYVASENMELSEVSLGNLSDNLALDMLLNVSGRLDYVHDAGSIAAHWTVVPSGVVSSTTLPGNGALGSGRGVYTTGTSIFLVQKDPGRTSSFTVTDQNRADFGGCELRTGPWGENTLLLGFKGSTIWFTLWEGTSLLNTFSITAPGTVHDVTTMNWNAAGNNELIVLAGSSLYVYQPDGYLLTTVAGVAGGQVVVSRADAGLGRDVALWEHPSPGSAATTLVALHADGAVSRPFVDAAMGLVVLDHDGDGLDDVMRLGKRPETVSPPRNGDGELFERAGAGYDLTSFAALFPQAGVASGYQLPCFVPAEGTVVKGSAAGDVDNDGDADYVVISSGSGNKDIRLKLNDAVDEEALRFTWPAQNNFWVNAQGTWETNHYELFAPGNPAAMNVATDVQVEMWFQSSVGAPTGRSYQPGATAAEYLGVPSTFPITTYFAYAPVQPIRMYAWTWVTNVGNVEVGRGPTTLILGAPSPTVYQALWASLPNGCQPPDPEGDPGGSANAGRGGNNGGTTPP